MNLAPKAEEFATAEMAEDPRYRANDPFARPQSAGSGGDPLAELARLIGQNDPFGDLNRDPRGADPRGALPRPDQRQPGTAPSVDWRSAPQPDPFRQAQPAAPPAYTDPYAGHAAPHQATHFSGLHQPQHASQSPVNGQPYAGAPGYPASPADAHPQGYDPAAYGQQPGYEQQAYEADPYYREDQPQDGMYPAAYEDAGAPRRRGGILTVLAVLALAIVGTAGAFGYRAVFGNSNALATPPVIRADGAPTKIVPAAQSGEPQSNKLIYDRVGDRNQGEKVVGREEQPVEIREPVPPRAIFPGQANAQQGAMPANASALAPVTSAPPGVGEPKKVRTVTIRADQPNGPSAAPPPPARNSNPQFPAAASAMPEPMAPAPRASRIPSAPSGNAPLSLQPPSGPVPQQAVPQTMPPAPRAPAPSRVASAPVEGGAYVQVSSQRSEGEAQSSFRSLQARFPNVLGGRQAIIRRADLGDKGTYYRAQVGPFGSSAEANQLCESLRAAGGQCVVQRN